MFRPLNFFHDRNRSLISLYDHVVIESSLMFINSFVFCLFCVCVYVTHMCACVWKPELNVWCLPQFAYLGFEMGPFHLVPYLHLRGTGIVATHYCTSLLVWLLGVHIHVLVLCSRYITYQAISWPLDIPVLVLLNRRMSSSVCWA